MARRVSPEDRTFLQTIKLLFVEDDAEIRKQLSEFLSREIGEVAAACNGEEGLSLYREMRPDVIVTDVQMPIKDGLTMAEEIRHLDPDAAMIITSAFNDESYLLRAIEIGVDAYVRKPVMPRKLLAAILKSARLLRERRRVGEANLYARFLLDIFPNLMLVATWSPGREAQVEYLNRPFLDLLGCEDMAAYGGGDLEIAEIMETLEQEPLIHERGGWVHFLLESRERLPIIYMRSGSASDAVRRAYAVNANSLPGGEKYIFSFTDIERIENQLKSLEKKAFTDALTGTCTRAKLKGFLFAEVERVRRHGGALSLILFDIDHFKRVNDRFGHAQGDMVLVEICRMVTGRIRASDMLSRWGGEEFLLVLPGVGVEAAQQVADKLRTVIAGRDFAQVGRVTGSFGVTQLLASDDVHLLIERADMLLSKAKDAGRNRVEAG
ncbi:MAG: diguanylate cyclase [Magnetococcales bacterium]|nr:diguanylate cyclase [Magnetococcales bacterium]